MGAPVEVARHHPEKGVVLAVDEDPCLEEVVAAGPHGDVIGDVDELFVVEVELNIHIWELLVAPDRMERVGVCDVD